VSDILFEKVLVPVNASDLSERVVIQVARLIRSGIVGEVVLMSVWEADKIDYTKLHASDKETKLKNQAREVLQKYSTQLKEQGIEVKTNLSGGDPSELILQEVKKGKYDLIIMGSRKLNKLQELMFGSVSDRVTRLCSVPVLVVK
jgi:nucleotide-binding universal stress UspA family protein